MIEGLDLKTAFLASLRSIEGTYGIALVSSSAPGEIYLARRGSPLVIGQGDGFLVAASDPSAIISHTRSVVYLDDNECAILRADGFESFRLDETPTVKAVEKLTIDLASVELGGYTHFMEKEIHEQPQTILDAMRGRIRRAEGTIHLGGIDDSLLLKAKHIAIIACGTSWHAGLIGKYLFEGMAGIPTEVCYAAEFRYASPALEPGTLVIAISQSGETADTLAGIREARRLGAAGHGHRERGGQHHRPRVRPGRLPPRGSGDRGRVHQGVYEPGGGALPARASGKPYARDVLSATDSCSSTPSPVSATRQPARSN